MDIYDEVDKTYRDLKNNSSREYESICPTVERVDDVVLGDVPSTPADTQYEAIMEELHYWGVIWDVQALIRKYGIIQVTKDIHANPS